MSDENDSKKRKATKNMFWSVLGHFASLIVLETDNHKQSRQCYDNRAMSRNSNDAWLYGS